MNIIALFAIQFRSEEFATLLITLIMIWTLNQVLLNLAGWAGVNVS